MVSSSDRATIVYVAKLADQAERYDDMVEGLMKLAKMDVDLTAEEKILLSVGYKQVIFSRRASWRILSSIEQNEHNEQNTKRIKEYMQKVETELTNICNQVISVIDKHLIPSCTDGTALVFYYKMSGDYYRYLAEFKTGDDRKVVVDQAQSAYELATTTAKAELPCTHPIRLGLALNFAVFYYEILKSTERACDLAEQAFQEALSLLDTLNEESFKDTALIMELLSDNLLLWINGKSDDAEENAANKAEEWQRWCREQLSND